MARQEHDREDLLAEATALVERARISWQGQSEPVVAGFRADGAASIYLGLDAVYHFNSRGELRRAFVDGLIYKAVGGGLASLRKDRTQDQVVLLRHDLDEAAMLAFVEEMTSRLIALRSALHTNAFARIECQPPQADVAGRLLQWLAEHAGRPVIAESPGAMGGRPQPG